jgi:hypothetical protein
MHFCFFAFIFVMFWKNFFFFFCDGCFQDRVLQTICLSWLRNEILLISAS